MEQFISRCCSEPRLAFNQGRALRSGLYLEVREEPVSEERGPSRA